jgi:hypothetical protein
MGCSVILILVIYLKYIEIYRNKLVIYIKKIQNI